MKVIDHSSLKFISFGFVSGRSSKVIAIAVNPKTLESNWIVMTGTSQAERFGKTVYFGKSQEAAEAVYAAMS